MPTRSRPPPPSPPSRPPSVPAAPRGRCRPRPRSSATSGCWRRAPVPWDQWPAPPAGRYWARHGGRSDMAIQLNHTIIPSPDKVASAVFLAEILDLDAPTPYGPFMCLETANGVSLDYADHDGTIEPSHYAFLVSEDEFDGI